MISVQEVVLTIEKLIEEHDKKHEKKAFEYLSARNNLGWEAYTERGIALHDLLTDLKRLPFWKTND